MVGDTFVPMVTTAAPPPPIRDSKLDLVELQHLARSFDEIGDQIGGARYPAVAFVEWLADEHAATGRGPIRDRRSNGR